MKDQKANFRRWARQVNVFGPAARRLDFRLRDDPDTSKLLVTTIERLKKWVIHGPFIPVSIHAIIICFSVN